MKLAIRDDDTSYFTSPDALERVYHDVWDSVPVCLAVVPFAIGYPQPGIPQEYWSSREPMPLDRNPALVSFLRALIAGGKATIALHGCTHQDFPGGSEFQAAPDPAERIQRGRTYLESLLGCRISTFVPPHNALSKRSLVALSDARLNLLGSFLSFRPSMRPWDRRTGFNWWTVHRFRRATGRTRRDQFVYPFPLRYARYTEFGCHSLVPGTTFEMLRAQFDAARGSGGDFCLATHYWEIDARLKHVMDEFLAFAAKQPNVRLVAVEQLFT